MKLRDGKSASERRKFIEKETGTVLPGIGTFSFDESVVSQKNCENLIGSTHIPLGIAGPLSSNSRKHYIPLATTEGALVASISRGAKAITESGGASAYAYRIGATRGPVFHTTSIAEDQKVYTWITEHKQQLMKEGESTSHHVRITSIEITGATPYLFLRIYFDTEDAMGMNMATIATDKMVTLIETQTGVNCVAIAGNFDVDKKPSAMNMINKRGWQSGADVIISRDVVIDVLKTTPEKFIKTWLAKCLVGSALSGSLGFNAQFANVIAALFIATGQDPAHVVEGSIGMTFAEVVDNGDLRVSVYLPSLMVGTVGGGTGLITQKEALSILGIAGTGKTHKFAEIVASAVLAGEISLLASLSVGSLAAAHKSLGRGEKTI